MTMPFWILIVVLASIAQPTGDPLRHAHQHFRFTTEAHCQAAADALFQALTVLDTVCVEIK